jgi:hypothetical protein
LDFLFITASEKAMMTKTKIFLGAFLCAACSLMLPTANANIIDSTYGAGAGSFELGNFVDNGGGFMSLVPGDTTITGWTVGSGDGVDWLLAPTFRADTGIHALDLQRAANGSITTIIPTVAGNVYGLSFEAAAVLSYGNATGVVSAGSLVNQSFTAAFSSDTSTQTYTPFTFLFTATGSTSMLQFTGTGPNSGALSYGPVIDSVSVDLVSVPPSPSVPEPSSIALLLLGGGVLCIRRLTGRRCGMRNTYSLANYDPYIMNG